MPNQPVQLRSLPQRRGLTLTELLVVVAIMVVVAAVFVPMVQPILRGQNTREASRQLNVMIAGVQAKAVALGRPVGIWFERAAHEATAPPERWFTSYRVFEAVEPVPYTGDVYDARVAVRQFPGGTGELWQANFLSPAPNAILQVQSGDTIRFNGRGPRYMIREVTPQAILFTVPLNLAPGTQPMLSPAKYVNVVPGVTFEIFRQPIKSTSAPTELPNNVGIDLSLSGYANPNSPIPSSRMPSFRQIPAALEFEMTRRGITDIPLRYPEYDIAIMFSPNGGVDRVHYIPHEHEHEDGVAEPLLPYLAEVPYGKISLLIARDDKIGKDLEGQVNVTSTPGRVGISSLNEQSNIWISIAGHSGRVQAGPNAALPPAVLNKDIELLLRDARRLADTGQTMGGR